MPKPNSDCFFFSTQLKYKDELFPSITVPSLPSKFRDLFKVISLFPERPYILPSSLTVSFSAALSIMSLISSKLPSSASVGLSLDAGLKFSIGVVPFSPADTIPIVMNKINVSTVNLKILFLIVSPVLNILIVYTLNISLFLSYFYKCRTSKILIDILDILTFIKLLKEMILNENVLR